MRCKIIKPQRMQIQRHETILYWININLRMKFFLVEESVSDYKLSKRSGQFSSAYKAISTLKIIRELISLALSKKPTQRVNRVFYRRYIAYKFLLLNKYTLFTRKCCVISIQHVILSL